MRHRKKQLKLGRRLGHRTQLIRSLAVSALLHERVRTTATKARAVQPFVERCVTLGKEHTLVRRRALLALLRNPRAVGKLLEVIGPRYASRHGGYTRITPLGSRAGDAAPEALIEFV